MTRTLPLARDEFVSAMHRDTPGTDRPRYLAVLDAMIAWSLARPGKLRFRADETRQGVISFERTDSSVVFWSARPKRGDSPKLELLPRGSRALSPDQRASAVSALNSHSRAVLAADDPLRIGFGALKNTTARKAVLELMDSLLQTT